MKKTVLALAALSGLTSAIASANECTGELYGINAGRGHVGVMFSLDEAAQSAAIHSKAKFSSAAMAFDSQRNRMYYVSAPRALEYKLDPSELGLSKDELASLPIKAERFKYTRIAYVDMTTNEHTTLSRSAPMYRLAYDAASDTLYGSQGSKLYSINPESGETTLVGKMTGHKNSTDISRGDMVFKDGQAYIVTSGGIFSLDMNTLKLTKQADHDLVAVTGAALDQNGELIIAREVINDQGHTNTTKLYKASIETGKTCALGSYPIRINDLASNSLKPVACYAQPTCSVASAPSFVVTSITKDRYSAAPGYTLNGKLMTNALTKLTSEQNFGEHGTVYKTVAVNHDFAEADSISAAALEDYKTDVFLIGNFSQSNFTDNELAEAYNWSLQPGNVTVIAADAEVYGSIQVFAKWGYEVTRDHSGTASTPLEVAVAPVAQQAIFAGPFGDVTEAYPAGGVKGYFTRMPEGAQVLATNQDGHPTMALDTATGDIILADSGYITNQSKIGNFTSGEGVTSMSERLFMNLINFASEKE